MIGVAIPAHNEAAMLAACLAAVLRAARAPGVDEEVRVVVVLDSCSDESPRIAREFGVDCCTVAARNVGLARAAGADHLLALGVRWLAFTDADTQVDDAWLAAQLAHIALGAEAVCGTVGVRDWDCRGSEGRRLAERFAARYTDAEDHRHVHGANLGVCAQAYRRAGGFPPLPCHEDVALVRALAAAGARIAWSAQPRVYTSARAQARAPEGFAAALAALALQDMGTVAGAAGAARA